MNVVTHAARDAHAYGWIGSLMTVTFFVAFVGWIAWAYWPSNRARFEADARIPLDDDLGGA